MSQNPLKLPLLQFTLFEYNIAATQKCHVTQVLKRVNNKI